MEELETDETRFAATRSVAETGDPVITLSGDLDISSAEIFRRAVEDVVKDGPGRLVIDLRELTFMDSSGIAVMVYASNNVADVRLCHASTIVRRVIEVTGLSDVLRLEPS
jgi:anti-anti-sigma factor